jgi:hypothetical protein
MKVKHLFKISCDETYCGISAEDIRFRTYTSSSVSMTMDASKHTCDECDRAFGLYLLSQVA